MRFRTAAGAEIDLLLSRFTVLQREWAALFEAASSERACPASWVYLALK
ncbi:MAG: hypothetical protein ACREUK_08585 [Burkholderiales bacterium]